MLIDKSTYEHYINLMAFDIHELYEITTNLNYRRLQKRWAEVINIKVWDRREEDDKRK